MFEIDLKRRYDLILIFVKPNIISITILKYSVKALHVDNVLPHLPPGKLTNTSETDLKTVGK